jgi:hypothetical protein
MVPVCFGKEITLQFGMLVSERTIGLFDSLGFRVEICVGVAVALQK